MRWWITPRWHHALQGLLSWVLRGRVVDPWLEVWLLFYWCNSVQSGFSSASEEKGRCYLSFDGAKNRAAFPIKLDLAALEGLPHGRSN